MAYFFPILTKNLNFSNSISMASKKYRSLSLLWKNPSLDFFWDCRIASQFCTLLSRHPWLFICWQERNTFPEPALEKSLLGFFQGLRNRKAIPHAAKPPSMAQYSLARKKNRSLSLSKGTYLKETNRPQRNIGVLRGNP